MRREAENLRLRALVRAQLMHHHGDRDKLLYSMRQAWDEQALKALGYTSYEEFRCAEVHDG